MMKTRVSHNCLKHGIILLIYSTPLKLEPLIESMLTSKSYSLEQFWRAPLLYSATGTAVAIMNIVDVEADPPGFL
jgi:hypothetical protein